jgi:methionyl-tRNA synthetase
MANILVTTSIPYANANPHIGFAMELVEGDAIARYHREIGDQVFFLTGTDEHGTKMWRTAKEQGKETQEFVDEKAERYKELITALNTSPDGFIRTSQERHKRGAKKLWQKIANQDFFEKRKFAGLYCPGCEAFFTTKDLVDGKCPNHLKEPEFLEEENWFFKLSEVSEQIIQLITSDNLKIIPEYRKNEILEFAKKGLRDISFSRPRWVLPWGVAVPGDDEQVMYVWCDALTNYITGLGYGSQDESLFEQFWNQGTKIQIIGKDILRFHAAFWPGMLLVAGEKTPDKLLVHGFLTSEGQKMSKSLGNVVDPFEITHEHGADALRFFLIHEVPFGRDADFSQARFEEIKNAYLADGLGNLLSRVHTLATRLKMNPGLLKGFVNQEFATNLTKAQEKQKEAMASYQLHLATSAAFDYISWLNRKINELEPWKLIKNNPKNAEEIIGDFLLALKETMPLLRPFIPESMAKVKKALNLDNQDNFQDALGASIILFPKSS